MNIFSKVLIVLIALLIGISIIHDESTSRIGEAGRKKMITRGFISIGIGMLVILYMAYAYVTFGSNALQGVIIFGLLALLAFSTGILTLIRTSQEKNSEIAVTHIVNCRIERRRSRGLSYYWVSGNSLEGLKNTFTFGGNDRLIIENAMNAGRNSFEIVYYRSSGRIIEIH